MSAFSTSGEESERWGLWFGFTLFMGENGDGLTKRFAGPKLGLRAMLAVLSSYYPKFYNTGLKCYDL